MMKYVLVNESTLADWGHGGELTREILVRIATVCSMQLNGPFSQAWGGGYAVRVALDKDDVQPEETAVWITDSLNVPGACGYHDRLPNGSPVVYISREFATDLTSGAAALSVTISHELLEGAADPATNRWVDLGNNLEEALEVSDRVQDTTYQSIGISLSDFLLPSAFDPGAKGPYSYCNALSAPTAMTSGGYALVRSTVDNEHQVTTNGTVPPAKADKAHHPSSRLYKRGLLV